MEHAPGAPAHLSVSLAPLCDAGRGASLVVVSPQAAPHGLLEEISAPVPLTPARPRKARRRPAPQRC